MNDIERARATDIRALLIAAAALFVVTVVIGILNGLDLVEFDHNTLMTHVHAGTLGWITLAVFAACGWIFGPSRSAGEARLWRWSARLAIVSFMLYVAAFWSGNISLRAIFAVPATVAIGGMANVQALLMVNTLFQLVAVVIFVARLGRPVLAVQWLAPRPPRFFGAAAVFVVVDVALLIFIIIQFVSGAYRPPDQDPSLMAIPPWFIFALDHAIFIGVMSNAIFGLLAILGRGNEFAGRWADHLVFWGMNVGLIGFVVGLALESAILKQVFSPIMGASILVGLAVYVVRLWQADPVAALDQGA